MDYIGKRVARWRDLAGMTQQDLADRLGRTQAWVSMVENGHRPVTRRDTLIQLANALKVDVQQLIAQPSIRTKDELTIRRAIPGLRAALYGPDEQPPARPTEDVAGDVERLMVARMACDYAALASLMAPMVAETAALVDTGRDGQRARELAVRALYAASMVVRPMGYIDLAYALAERAASVAGELDGPAELAAARFALAQAALASGSRRRSLRVADRAAKEAQGATGPGALAWYGILQLQIALASASLGEDSEAHLSEAREVVGQRPDDPWLMEFTPANVAAWDAAVALETDDYDRVLSTVRAVPRDGLRTAQRRSHLLMFAGRAYAATGDTERAVRSILEADEIAPAEVRSRPAIREVVGQMARDVFRGTELATLAARIGVDPLT
jgi:transcriptional regulator with XRE-family HTH domain